MSFLEIANGNIMYLLAILVIVFVLVQSVIFLVRALREARRIGMEQGRIKKVITSSAIFSVVPSLPIIISLFALMPLLGIPLPWIRLSVVGSASYELVAAESAAKGFGYSNLSEAAAGGGQAFAGIAWVMTLGIIWGLLFSTFYQKKLQSQIGTLREKDLSLIHI